MTETFLDLLVSRDGVSHFSVIELRICHQVEITCSRETEKNGLFLSRFLAFQGLVNGCTYRVAAFRCRERAFRAGKQFRRLEYGSLLDGTGLHVAVGIEL